MAIFIVEGREWLASFLS